MTTLILTLSIILASAAYWITDTVDCWINPGTDTCVGCTDDCLEPLTDKE